jgi:hypothetical protein
MSHHEERCGRASSSSGGSTVAPFTVAFHSTRLCVFRLQFVAFICYRASSPDSSHLTASAYSWSTFWLLQGLSSWVPKRWRILPVHVLAGSCSADFRPWRFRFHRNVGSYTDSDGAVYQKMITFVRGFAFFNAHLLSKACVSASWV